MIGLCFEGTSPCHNCAKPLALNALVENIVCNECLAVNKFSVDDWKELLEDVFKSAPTFKEDEGQPSTIMGSRNYKIIYGRQNPKFSDTKTYIEMDKAISDIGSGKVVNTQTQKAFSIRKLPEKFALACPNVSYLVGEDFTQLPNHSGSSDFLTAKSNQALVAFSCPTCAGSLQTDGSTRTLKCQFCSNEIFIPDETWQKMHPVNTMQRFYFWYDEKTVKFEWDSDLYDCFAGPDGTLYLSVEPIFGSDEKLWIVALNPDLTIKWKRTDLKFKTNTGGGEPKLGLNAQGELMIWSWDRNTMALLSSKDGTEIRRIGTKPEEESESTVMNFKNCRYIAATSDGKYFALNYRSGENTSSYVEFVVLDQDANILKPWSGESAKKGFFGSLKKAISGMGDIPYMEKLKDQPTKCNDIDIKVSVGLDGSYYLLEHYDLVKLDKNGNHIYHYKIEKGYVKHRICGDAQGNAYFLKDHDGNDTNSLIRISPDGEKEEEFIQSVLTGGKLCEEDMLAMSADGTIYCAGYGGRIRIFDAQGNMKYASPYSLENEKDAMEEREEMEDE